jgi:hypothetical protein
MSDLLDREMPRWHFRERHAVAIEAPPSAIWRALHEVRPVEVRLLRELFWLRTLPSRLRGRSSPAPDDARPLLGQVQESGFVLLCEEPDREIVLGIVGRFWGPSARPLPFADAAAYRAFVEPSYARAAINFRLDGTRLSTETRILIPDSAARRRFALYWLFVRPGSALLRRTWLRAIERRAAT